MTGSGQRDDKWVDMTGQCQVMSGRKRGQVFESDISFEVE